MSKVVSSEELEVQLEAFRGLPGPAGKDYVLTEEDKQEIAGMVPTSLPAPTLFATPRMYGAEGDGATDDTAAFQAMFDECGKTGRIMFIPDGDYIINTPIILRPFADGYAYNVKGQKYANSDTEAKSFSNLHFSTHLFTVQTAYDVVQLNMDGVNAYRNNPADAAADSAVLWQVNLYRSEIQSCSFTNAGWFLYGGMNIKTTVHNCQFKKCRKGFIYIPHASNGIADSSIYSNYINGAHGAAQAVADRTSVFMSEDVRSVDTDVFIFDNFVDYFAYWMKAVWVDEEYKPNASTGCKCGNVHHNVIQEFFTMCAPNTVMSGTFESNHFMRFTAQSDFITQTMPNCANSKVGPFVLECAQGELTDIASADENAVVAECRNFTELNLIDNAFADCDWFLHYAPQTDVGYYDAVGVRERGTHSIGANTSTTRLSDKFVMQPVRRQLGTSLFHGFIAECRSLDRLRVDGASADNPILIKNAADRSVFTAANGQIRYFTDGVFMAVQTGDASFAWVQLDGADGGNDYTLPIASSTTLGGVMPAAKTEEMTQEVGVDADGRLWGMPGGGVLEKMEFIGTYTLPEDAAEWIIDKEVDGITPIKLKRMAYNFVIKAAQINIDGAINNTNAIFSMPGWINPYGTNVHIKNYNCLRTGDYNRLDYYDIWDIVTVGDMDIVIDHRKSNVAGCEVTAGTAETIGGYITGIAARSDAVDTAHFGAGSYINIWGGKSMKICVNGKCRDMTADELAQIQEDALNARIDSASRPMTADEVLKLTIKKQVNSLGIPEATASRMADYYPTTADFDAGALIAAGTIINHGGTLKRANADLWNTEENGPDSAPTLWSDIAYRDGVRVIPESMAAEQAFALDELGWQDGHIYRSRMDGNVYPVTQADAWEKVR